MDWIGFSKLRAAPIYALKTYLWPHSRLQGCLTRCCQLQHRLVSCSSRECNAQLFTQSVSDCCGCWPDMSASMVPMGASAMLAWLTTMLTWLTTNDLHAIQLALCPSSPVGCILHHAIQDWQTAKCRVLIPQQADAQCRRLVPSLLMHCKQDHTLSVSPCFCLAASSQSFLRRSPVCSRFLARNSTWSSYACLHLYPCSAARLLRDCCDTALS